MAKQDRMGLHGRLLRWPERGRRKLSGFMEVRKRGQQCLLLRCQMEFGFRNVDII